MNARTILQSGCEVPGVPAGDGGVLVKGDRLDLTLAACSRLLLGDENTTDALQKALARLAFGFDARHVTLFQIESYHADDNRGRWRACSSAGPCPYCQDSLEWDYIRLIDEDIRARLEKGQCCHLNVNQLPPDFQGDFRTRNVDSLIILPLTVLGKWWGFLCIEVVPEGFRWAPGQESHLETLGALFSVYYERRHAVEGYQERNELSGALEMAGTVCHKLNQPMQVILGYASMVTSGDIRDKEQIIEIVQLIEDETRQMGIITKNLMGITKNRGAE
jgi:GAF domain-containing protein